MKGEPPLAWGAFVCYRDMGTDRTLETVRKLLGKEQGYLSTLERWSRVWRWGQRCLKWDAWIDRKTREVAESRMPLWEQRRQESLERNMEEAARLRSHLGEMMDRPLTRTETRESQDGKTIWHIVEPARWNWGTVFAGVKMVAELEAATIAEGLLESDDEDFDVESASPEQLKAFVQRHRRRRGTGGSSSPTLDQFQS